MSAGRPTRLSQSVNQWPGYVARGIVKGVGFLANMCLILMLLIIFTNVIMRYAVGRPLYWGDDTMINLLMIMAYTSFGSLVADGKHIRVTIVFDRMSARVQKVMWVIVSFFGIGYAGYLIYAVVWLVLDSLKLMPISMETRWPLYPWQIIIAIGIFGLLVAFLAFMAEKVGVALGIRKTEEERGKEEEDVLKVRD